MGGGREPGVAFPTPTALGDQDLITWLEDFLDQLATLCVMNFRAQRHGKIDMVSGATRAVGSLAVPAALGLEMRAVLIVQQRGELRIGPDVDAATMPPITAVGTALGNEDLAAERLRSRAPGTRGYPDYGAINECHGSPVGPSGGRDYQVVAWRKVPKETFRG
jgi:hypothetical protein